MFTGEHTSLALAARQVRATSGEVLQKRSHRRGQPEPSTSRKCSQRKSVITASNDSTAQLWDVGAIPKGDLFAIACARLPDYDLTYVAPDYGLTNLKAICQEGPPLFDGPWSSGGSR